MSARAIWTGTMTVGLVTVPIKAYKATDEPSAETAMRQLHGGAKGCNQPINQKTICVACNVDVPASDIIKGVAIDGGKFVVLTKAELDDIRPESSESILLDAMVPVSDIDPLYVDASYYITADGTAAQLPYVMLHTAMVNKRKAAQGRLAIYGRERNVTMRPVGSGFVLQLMRTGNEVRQQDQLPGFIAKGVVKVDPQQLKLAEQLVDMYAGEFDATEYVDSYADEFKALVASKVAGTPVAGKPVKAAPKGGDLMAALKASLTAPGKVAKAKQIKVGTKALGPKSSKKAS